MRNPGLLPQWARPWLVLAIGAIFMTSGVSQLAQPRNLADDTPYAGTLLRASASEGRFGNNTTLTVSDREGQTHAFTVKSAPPWREVGRIRDQARQNIGSDVIYWADGSQLIEMQFRDGPILVSADQTHSQVRFNGWAQFLMGFGLLGLTLPMWRRKQTDSPP